MDDKLTPEQVMKALEQFTPPGAEPKPEPQIGKGPSFKIPPRHRRLFWAGYTVFIILLIETVARIFWMSSGPVSFFNVPRRLYYVFYPELKTVLVNDVVEYDADYKILLLGGSSVLPSWGSIEQVLRERLVNQTGRPVRIDNLGGEGHTSRDSLIKYRHLKRHRYDLVIVYDGINDCRTNNVPTDRFRPDYSHYAWYHLVNREEKSGPHRISVIPFTMNYLYARLFGSRQFLPVEMPISELVRYGGEIKSREPFKTHLREIVKLAGERNEPVMLMTFATHEPPNYTHELFMQKMLDYTLHSVATQLWGAPPFVLEGVRQHNAAIRELAQEFSSKPNVLFVDQAKLIPGEGKNFNDICHLTVAGSEQWVEDALPQIIPLLKAKGLPPLAVKNATPVNPDKINYDL